MKINLNAEGPRSAPERWPGLKCTGQLLAPIAHIHQGLFGVVCGVREEFIPRWGSLQRSKGLFVTSLKIMLPIARPELRGALELPLEMSDLARLPARQLGAGKAFDLGI